MSDSNVVHMRELIHDLLSLQSAIENHENGKNPSCVPQQWQGVPVYKLKAYFDTALAEHDACADAVTTQQYARATKWAKAQLKNDLPDDSW